MDPQTALSRALLLLLFLHLSLLGCRSHPLGGPGSASELPGLQELLDRLRDRVSELQAEQLRVEPLQQGQGLEETWDSPAAAPAGFLGPHHSLLRALRGPKMMRDSGCFGRRLDRIGSLSGLGCNDCSKMLGPMKFSGEVHHDQPTTNQPTNYQSTYH
ncbi:hypothetical protein MJG53_011095 [Ovis ammon polii x Ovis aries]|uniref:Uncharacterized protein n=1 Tax=Ovis ammon polii x Ovis aries TaxID=2918886 RepID=A0ACB9UR63_9CETA|nr:hypothetical protein MJG53_011095 [Ovis ammon polii x Ovis aries]